MVGIGLGRWPTARRRKRAGAATARIVLSNAILSADATAGTALGTLSVVNGAGTWTFTEIAPLASSLAVASGGAVTTVGTLTAGTQALAVSATNGTETLTANFTATFVAVASAPSATANFTDAAKANFFNVSDPISLKLHGLDFGYNQQGEGAIARVDDPTGLHGKVLEFTGGVGDAAYVARNFRFAAHNTSTSGYAAWLASLAQGHFAWLAYIASGSGKLFSTHLAADTAQATEQFSLGYVAFGSGFKFTVNGTAVGREIPYGWVRYGTSWDATADTLSLFSKLTGEGSWTTERSGAITAFAAPSSFRFGLWTTAGGLVRIKYMGWSDTSFAEASEDYTFAGCSVAFTDQTRASVNFHCPDGLVGSAYQARVRWNAGDDPSGGTASATQLLSSKVHSTLQFILTGLTHNSNLSVQLEYLDAFGNVLKTSQPFLFGTTANAGTSVSAQYVAHCCYESVTWGHPFREVEDSIARLNADYRKIGFLMGGDGFYEQTVMSDFGYRFHRPNSTEEHAEMGYREFFSDPCIFRIAQRGPLRWYTDDHEYLNEYDVRYLAGGPLENTNVNALSNNSSFWPNDLTTGVLLTRMIAVGNSWVDRHALASPVAGRNYYRLTHGNIEFFMMDTRRGRNDDVKYLDDAQFTYWSDQITAINTAGTVKLTINHCQAGIASWISKTQEGWHNNVPAQADAFNDLQATMPGVYFTQAGDVHIANAFHRQWDATPNYPTTPPAGWLGEAKSSGGVMAVAGNVLGDVASANTLWKNNLSALASNKVIRSSPTVCTVGVDAATIDLASGSATVASYRMYTAPVTDTDAPVLYDLTATQTGPTTATIGVTTDEGNGSLFWFISTSATPPTGANLIAGTGAVVSGSQTITSTGAKSVSVTGLTAATTYYTYVCHRDAAGNVSNIPTGASFTTAAADTTPPTITSATTAIVAENQLLSYTATANEAVTWSITGGADAADFEFSGATLRWAGNVTRDFEAPADADTNNTYVVQITATDGVGLTASQTVTVTVTDVAEGALVQDTFTAADGTTQDGRSPNVGGTWVATAKAGSLQVSGNKLVAATEGTGTGIAICHNPTALNNNHYAKGRLDFTSAMVAVVGPAVRVNTTTGANYHIVYNKANNQWRTRYAVAGATPVTLATQNETLTSGSRMVEIQAYNSGADVQVDVYFDGVKQTALCFLDTTASKITSGTNAGVIGFRGGTNNNTGGMDDYEAGNL